LLTNFREALLMRVLLVEDDQATSRSIELMLKQEGFVCDTSALGEDGLEVGKLYDYDIILLDLMLPDMDGYEVLRRFRAGRIKTPILILSGLTELDAKIKGLGFGADDYLTKPFDKRELIARIHAIVRRSKGHSQSIIKTGKLMVNLEARTVEAGTRPLHLTGKEYAILELLSLRKGTTLTKELFLNHLYGGIDEAPATAKTTSKRSGAAATCCAIRPPRGRPPNYPTLAPPPGATTW